MYVNVSIPYNGSAKVDPYEGLSILDIKRLEYPLWGHQLVGLFLLLVFVFGLVENTLIIYTFYKCKYLLSPTNIFILGLSISDLCMTTLGNPLATTSALYGKWFAGHFFCLWEAFIVYVCGLTELYLLVAISVNRYVVIVKPLSGSFFTKRVAALSVLGCAGLGIAWSLPPFFGWSSYGLEAPGISCGLHWEDQGLSNLTYLFAITIFCYFVPFGIMVYCYSNVYATIRGVNKNMIWDMRSAVARKNLKVEKKILKSCVIMCSVYFLVWLPYALVSIWQTLGDPDTIPLFLTELPAAAAKSEVVYNPLIYVLTNKQFRRALIGLIPVQEIRERLMKREDEMKEAESEESGDAGKEDMNKKVNNGNNIATKTPNPIAVAPAPQAGPTKVEC